MGKKENRDKLIMSLKITLLWDRRSGTTEMKTRVYFPRHFYRSVAMIARFLLAVGQHKPSITLSYLVSFIILPLTLTRGE